MLIECTECREAKECSATPEQIAVWRSGTLIQKAMPNVPPAERELLITGICGDCFDALFKPEDE